MDFNKFFNTCINDNTRYSLKYQRESDCYHFTSNGWGQEQPLKIWYYGKSWRDDRDLIHPALSQLSAELNEKLQDDGFIEKNTYLFNKEEYEHNTRDVFIQYTNLAKDPILDSALIQTSNLVGFVSKRIRNDLFSLQINSRFGNKFLMSMIADSDGFLELDDYGDISKNGWVEWLIVFLWKIKLKAAYRLGLPKEYVSTENLLHKVRGNLDMSHWLTNQEQYPPYVCNYREHSFDNTITRLINKTFHAIEHKQLIIDCSRIHHDFLIATLDKKVPVAELLKCGRIKNPYYAIYNDVVKLSKMLLRRQTGDFKSEQSDLSAFLFDISMLFEHFIRKSLMRGGYRLEEKNLATHRISRGKGDSSTRALKPDIVLRDENNCLQIFDVKYKHFSFSEGVNREDLFQLHTYLGHFLHNEEVVRCGLIYPITQSRLGTNKQILKNIIFQGGKMIDFEIHFFIVPEEVTQEIGNEQYYIMFRNSIQQFVQNFKSISDVKNWQKGT